MTYAFSGHDTVFEPGNQIVFALFFNREISIGLKVAVPIKITDLVLPFKTRLWFLVYGLWSRVSGLWFMVLVLPMSENSDGFCSAHCTLC